MILLDEIKLRGVCPECFGKPTTPHEHNLIQNRRSRQIRCAQCGHKFKIYTCACCHRIWESKHLATKTKYIGGADRRVCPFCSSLRFSPKLFFTLEMALEEGTEICARMDKKYKERPTNYRRTREPELKTKPYRAPIKPEVREEIYVRDGYTCQRCRRHQRDLESGNKLSIDHIFPVSKGGSSEMTNLQTLCLKCNMVKHDRIGN